MKINVILFVILGAIVLSLVLLFTDYNLRTSEDSSLQKILFPELIDYKTAPSSHVDIQRSCAEYFVHSFQNVTQNQVQQSKLLQTVVSGKVGDGLPFGGPETRQMLEVLGKMPDKSGKGEFGINHDGKSYYLKYEFVEKPRTYIDHVIGCYDDQLVSRFQDEPIVVAFEKQYGTDLFKRGSDDYVSFSKRINDVYSARLHIFLDQNHNVRNVTAYCNNYEKELYYEITEYDQAWNYVNNYHCYNDKYPIVKISINGFRSSYAVGDVMDDFTILLEGYYPNYGAPDVKLIENENVLWTNYDDIGHVIFGRSTPVDFCKEYRFYDIGGPVTLNYTGTYDIVFTFDGFSFDQTFYVRENTSGNIVQKPNFGCS